MGGLIVVVICACLIPQMTSSPLDYEIGNEDDNQKDYTGYKLLRTSPIQHSTKAQALMLSLDAKHGIQLWTIPKENQSTDILTSPTLYPHVKSLLDQLDIQHLILQDDINKLIQAERDETAAATIPATRQYPGHRMDWATYHRYDDIYNYAKYLSGQRKQSRSGAIVTMESLGSSFENRDIILLKITNGLGGTNKPAIWIDGGMHAREWISPATVTYIVKILVDDPERSSDLLEAFDWYIVPVVNVDGYEYSHARDRYWRKTRSRTSSFLGCRGVDPNRNWAYQWGGAGTSNDPCSDVYRGTKPFSEPETLAVSNAILARKDQIKLYLTFHSYSQLLLIPWGYGKAKPSDYKELYDLGLIGKKALESTYGTAYKMGTAPDLLYSAAGGSDDWAKGGAGIKYAYTFELRDKGQYGFNLPPSQITPTGEETFNGVRALALRLRETLRIKLPHTNPLRPINIPSRVPQQGHRANDISEIEYIHQDDY